jgi:aspartyl-tRNA(Asn)/glutamyl-tRNA(Gln) amidotransferase subunit C
MIDLATVNRMAELARLDLTDAERTLLATQLAAILDYVNQLESVDTIGSDAAAGANTGSDAAVGTHAEGEGSLGGPSGPPRSLILRADVPTPSLPRDLALANAPVVEAGQIRVPGFLPDDA